MKQRLNLDSLLKKYQQNYGLTPNNPAPRVEPKRNLTRNKTETFLHTQTQHNYYDTHAPFNTNTENNNPHTRTLNNLHFQMSKSECESLLMALKAQLKNEQQYVQQQINQSIAKLTQDFDRLHQQLRKQLYSLVQKALQSNKILVHELLENYKHKIPKEYQNIQQNIHNAETDINRLMNSLNGPEYKKTIAEVVTRDFTQFLLSIRNQTETCHAQLQINLKNIRIDQNKINSLPPQLARLYLWDQQETLARTSYNQEGTMGASRRSSRQKIFQSRQRPETEADNRSERSAPKRMRGTFFNFQQDY